MVGFARPIRYLVPSWYFDEVHSKPQLVVHTISNDAGHDCHLYMVAQVAYDLANGSNGNIKYGR